MFIRVIQGRATRRDELAAALRQAARAMPTARAGFLGGTYGFTDDDQLVTVLRFRDRTAAMMVSARPEVDRAIERLMALMDGPVELHNCDDVTTFLDGGPRSAGYVQVIRGRVDDPARLKAVVAETPVVHARAPEILGGTLAIEEDGTFTETIAFADERAAREAERMEPPPDVRDELAHAMRGAVFYDLPRPSFL